MKRIGIIKVSGLVLAAFALAVIPFLPATAEEDTAKPTAWIQISPVNERLNLGCEESHDGKFKVSNIGSEAFSFKVYANAYGVQDMTYDPIFGEEGAYSQLAKWISFGQGEYKDLGPGENIEVPYHIAIPADCPSGGQYAVLFAETIPKGEVSSGMGIQTISRVGMLVFVNLGGETRSTGEFIDFTQNWWTDEKVSSSTVVQNTGNVDFTVHQTYTVTSLFGAELYNNTSDKPVLPETTREITQKWEETPFMGLFNVTNKVSYLGQVPVDETKLVLVAPIWLIVTFSTVFCLIIALIVVIIVKSVRKSKQSKLTK